MLRLLIAFTLLVGLTFTVNAAQPAPTGDAVLNQAISGVVVTPSDSTVLVATRGLWNGNATACDIAVLFVNDTVAVTMKNVTNGINVPWAVTKVMSTNTTCSNIVALY